ncbi:MAG: threonine/serine exporter family protein [Clostridia bacterium]|nr:threonine/serine exporter family protein [Clostridia bacterium]
METFKILITALLGTAGFSIIFHIKFGHILPAALGGGLTCAAYLFFDGLGCALFLSNFLASLVAVLYSGILARLLKTPSTIFVALCIIPLVPGSGLFYSMRHLIVWDRELFFTHGPNAMQIALGIAAGIVLESAVVHLFGLVGKNSKEKT